VTTGPINRTPLVGGPDRSGVGALLLPLISKHIILCLFALLSGQVVMLGAGMDTRPWRLPLDPQVSWFEVDRADVLAAKQRALQEAGAGFTAAASTAAPTDSSKQADSSDSNSGGSSGSSGVQHPLRFGQWACASADLQKPGWVRKLQEAGLQADTPTVSGQPMGAHSTTTSGLATVTFLAISSVSWGAVAMFCPLSLKR
jgi:hypothetical protein